MRAKKLKISSNEVSEIILNKMLEKHGITISEIAELTRDTAGKIDDVYWFFKYTMTQEEHDIWKEWSLNFLKTEVSPRYSKALLKKSFESLNFMYGLKVTN